jgi:hypothetical protein
MAGFTSYFGRRETLVLEFANFIYFFFVNPW